MKYQYFFCFNEDYKYHALAAISSLVEKIAVIQNTKINILSADVTISTQKEIQKICGKIAVVFLHFRYSLPGDLKYVHHFNEANYYRLFIDEIVERGRCLYLDSDVIVNEPLEELFDLDLDGNAVAAVEDATFTDHDKLGLTTGARYFNSGVMLIDVIKWKEMAIREKVFYAINSNYSRIQFVDQCGLNLVLNGNWKPLDNTFNFQTGHCSDKHPYDKSNLPAIIHYTTGQKPSHFSSKHPFKKVYWKYRNRTSGRRLIGEGLTFQSVKRRLKSLYFREKERWENEITKNQD